MSERRESREECAERRLWSLGGLKSTAASCSRAELVAHSVYGSLRMERNNNNNHIELWSCVVRHELAGGEFGLWKLDESSSSVKYTTYRQPTVTYQDKKYSRRKREEKKKKSSITHFNTTDTNKLTLS